jgi:hypothetical protein
MERRMAGLKRGLLMLAVLLAGLGAGCSGRQSAGPAADAAAKYQGYVEVGGMVRL